MMNNNEKLMPSDLSDALIKKRNKKNAVVVNPTTGKCSFGRIPANKAGVPEGEIYLKLGDAGFGPKRQGAYGVRHIWEKHKTDLQLEEPEDVVKRMLEILTEGVEILVNHDANHNPARPVVLNTKVGRVALEQKTHEGKVVYTVISAYGAHNAPGVVIGTLKNPSD